MSKRFASILSTALTGAAILALAVSAGAGFVGPGW